MAMDVIQRGAVSGNGSEVDASGNQKVVLPADGGGIRIFSEVDPGLSIGTPSLMSPETDDDYRLRVSQDFLLDEECFNYTAHNSGKMTTYAVAATFAPSYTSTGWNTNPTSLVAASASAAMGSRATFPLLGTSTTSFDMELSFSTACPANTTVDFGGFIHSGAAPYAPTDGAYFRLTAAGLQGVVNYNGVETTTSVFEWQKNGGAWVPTANKKYQFILYVGVRDVNFWINDAGDVRLIGSLSTQAANGQPFANFSVPFNFRHVIGGTAASTGFNVQFSRYNVRIGGPNIITTGSTMGLRLYGSYQGLAGGTQGGLATYVNSTNPTAAAPSNTALTANLPGGLGGQGAVTAAAAAVTDGIWSEYAVPAPAVGVSGRRLVIRGVKLDLMNMGAAVATTPTTIQFALAFGHTAVSLATTESNFAKAPRRIALGFATWAVGAAIGAQPQCGPITLDLGDAPIFVNPGERVALVGKFLNGTATASQVINFTYTPIYGWE